MTRIRVRKKRSDAEAVTQNPTGALGSLLETRSEDDLKLWLTAGFRDNDWDEIVFDVVPTVAVQIQNAFRNSRAATQEKLRRAVIRAISEWTPNQPKVLSSLSVLAAYVKATRAATILSMHVLRHLVERDAEPAWVEATGIVIGVLAGLSPHPDANDVVESLYYDERVPVRYAAQLLQGMVRAKPGDFPVFLPRFVDIAVRHEELFRVDIILDRLVSDIGSRRFAESYEKLSPHTRLLLGDDLLPKAGMLYNKKEKTIEYLADDEAIRTNIDRRIDDRDAFQDLRAFLTLPIQ